MLAHSPRDSSRSPHSTNGTSLVHQDDTSIQNESTSNSKAKKDTESQQRMRNLKVS
jgi:hypothetical protein